MNPAQTGHLTPTPLSLPQLPGIESPDVQYNFRVSDTLKKAFLAAADQNGTNGTEALTRVMHAYIADTMGDATLHLDGSTCPLSTLISGFTVAVAEKLSRDGTLKHMAEEAIFETITPSKQEDHK